jgi:hypothetical protein
MSVGKLFSGTGSVFFHFAEDPFDLFLFHQNDFSGSDVVDRSRYFDLSGLDCGTDGSTVVKELPDFPVDYFHRKTANTKSAVLKFSINPALILRFFQKDEDIFA